MVTAIFKQQIRKRHHQRIMEANKTILVKQSEKPVIPGKLKDKTGSIMQHLSNNYTLIVFIIVIFFLFFLIFIVNPLNLYARTKASDLILPADPYFEAAIFNYAISGDVQISDGTQEDNPEKIQINNLNISYHQVAKRESVSDIARKYKLNIDTIISYNNIQNVRSINAGTKLAIPSIDGLKYKVRRGDALSTIANRFKITLNSLLDWNNINSETIHPGTEYFIPGARLSKNELNNILGILFISPVSGRLSSSFGWRKDPISGARSYHNGIDLVNDANTLIKAAMDGTVAKVSYSNVFGKYVIIKHSNGYQTLYGHMNRQLVSSNQKISQGETVGYMGNTGYSTGTHLHFAIFKNGEPVNPYNYLK